MAVTSNHRKRQNSLRAHGVYRLLLFSFPNESSSHEGLKPVFVQRNVNFRNGNITEPALNASGA